MIGSHRLLLGVTARVQDDLTGTTIWHLGVAANQKKFANPAPVARDTVVTGIANPPEAIWSPTPLVVTPSEGSLTSGRTAFAEFTLHLPVPEVSKFDRTRLQG